MQYCINISADTQNMSESVIEETRTNAKSIHIQTRGEKTTTKNN